MGFFSRNTRAITYSPHDNTPIFLDAITTDEWNGLEYVGIEALKNADVLTAVQMIATDIAGLSIKTSDAEKDSDLVRLMNVKPNNILNGYNLKYLIVANLILDGNVFVEVIKENGRAIELNFLPNSNVTIKVKKNDKKVTELFYEVRGYGKDNKTRVIKNKDMMHFKMLSTDGIVGQSPLRALQRDLNINKNSKSFLDNFFRHGTHAGGTLTAKNESLSPEAKKVVRDQWQKANAGANNSYKVLVLDEDFEYQPLKVDTELIKLVNSNDSSKTTIAQVLGIPLHKFGMSAPNMDLSQLNQDYLISTLKSYIDIILSELFKLDDQSEIQFDFNVDAYTNIDTKQMHENVKIERELGLISVDEARIKLGYNPLNNDVGNKFITNLNFVNSDIVDEYQLNKASSSKGGDK